MLAAPPVVTCAPPSPQCKIAMRFLVVYARRLDAATNGDEQATRIRCRYRKPFRDHLACNIRVVYTVGVSTFVFDVDKAKTHHAEHGLVNGTFGVRRLGWWRYHRRAVT